MSMFTDEEIALMILAGDCLTPEEFIERYGMGIQSWPSRKVLVRWTSVDENVAGALLSTWDKQYGWVRIR